MKVLYLLLLNNLLINIETYKGYSAKPVDIWALGVTLYIMIFKQLPFNENEDGVVGLMDKIAEAKVDFPKDKYISDGLKDLLLKMLTKDPNNRITCKDIKKHEWINKGKSDLSLDQ